MAEQTSSTKRRHHHRHHRKKSRKQKLRNGVVIATIAVCFLTVLGLWILRSYRPHTHEIVRQSYAVRVTNVLDGDTFIGISDNLDTMTYHVYCIEAPENDQPQGYESRKYLYNMILQRRVEIMPKGEAKDGIQHAVVTTRDNEDVADQMLRAGLAWYRNDTVNELSYIRSVRFAQEEGVGIWSRPDNVAPWVWRESHKE